MSKVKAGTRFVASYSGGKDSVLAIHRAMKAGMVLQALIITYNIDQGRSWFHGIPEEVLKEVESSIGVPVVLIKTSGQDYHLNFERVLREQKALGAQVCVFGDIDIDGHMDWGMDRCAAVGMEAYFPLWKESREALVHECVAEGFKPRITVVDSRRMSTDFLGRTITEALIGELKESGVDVCGENGEYHSFVTDGPIFKHPIPVIFEPVDIGGDFKVWSIKKREKPPAQEKGYIQVYTGNGKGKTTASMGLVLRAVGAGMRVYFGQFMKRGQTSEIKAMKVLGDAVTIEQFGDGKEITCPNVSEDCAAASAGLIKAREALLSGCYDLVVLDEINVAAWLKYISEKEMQVLMDEKPTHTELVFTGREALASVCDRADLVTEMRERKHYYQSGVMARRGIEM